MFTQQHYRVLWQALTEYRGMLLAELKDGYSNTRQGKQMQKEANYDLDLAKECIDIVMQMSLEK